MDSPVVSVARRDAAWTISGPASARSRWATDGAEVFAGWHADDQRLLLEHNRDGIHPFFYAATRDSIHLSTSISALLEAGISPDIDEAALAVFLRTGFFVGDDTPFAAIRAVPPAAALLWGPGSPSIRSRWTPPTPSRLKRAEAIAAFGDAFSRAIARCLSNTKGPSAILLSGGHDSRHILLALNELGQLPEVGVTVEPYPPYAPDDVRIAGIVAAAVGLPHAVLPYRPGRVAAEQEKNRLTHFCSDEHTQFMPLRAYFARHQYTVFDGLGGDVLSQSQRLDESLHRSFVTGRFDVVAERVLGDASSIEPALERLLTSAAYAQFSRPRAIARVAAEATRYADAPNPIGAFYFFTRMRREVALAPYGVLDNTAVHTPFLDRDVVDLLLSLPYAVVADRRLHTATIHKRYPAFAHLPFAGRTAGAEDRGLVRRDAVDLVRLIAARRPTYVRPRAVALRAARAWWSGKAADLWFLPRIVHLLDVAHWGGTEILRTRK